MQDLGQDEGKKKLMHVKKRVSGKFEKFKQTTVYTQCIEDTWKCLQLRC